MPRSHLPELPDVTAQATLEQWKIDLIDALRRERSYRSSSKSRRKSPERPTRSESSRTLRDSASRYGSSRYSNLHSSRSPTAQTSHSAGQGPSAASTPPASSTDSFVPAGTATAEPRIAEVVEETPSAASGTENSWRNAAWTIGSRLLYEALAALGREHTVRTEERQINMRLAAANAQQNQQLWTTVASWGAWSAHTALQYYFGSARGSNHLLGNG
jgi:hypothetical protein